MAVHASAISSKPSYYLVIFTACLSLVLVKSSIVLHADECSNSDISKEQLRF